MTQAHSIQTSNRACALLYEYIVRHADGTYLLPVNVCPDVPLTFVEADVGFEFVDIDPQTLCIDVDACLNLILGSRDRYAGIVFVHTYGCECHTVDIFSKLRAVARPGFAIIDDRCLCIPSTSAPADGADIVLYSTGHCKQIDLGHGALAKYASDYVFDEGIRSHYSAVDEVAVYKQSFDNGIPIRQMPHGWLCSDGCGFSDKEYFSLIRRGVGPRCIQREAINAIYRKMLPPELQLPERFQQWRFNIMVDQTKRDRVLNALFEHGLFASAHYQPVNAIFPEHCRYTYPNAYNLWAGIINLFNDDHYSTQMAISTCEVINGCLS